MAHVSGMIQVLRTIFLAALSVLVPVSGVRAQEDMVAVSIVNGWQMADGSHVAALKFVLADGWKTYWRAPGEAGIPPQFDWRGSRNLARAEIEWPTPKQTMTNGMRTIGYEHVLVLPLDTYRKVLDACPFAAQGLADGKSVHVYFADGTPQEPDAQTRALATGTETLAVRQGAAYLHAPDGIGRSKLAAKLDKALAVPVTARNWTTAQAIRALAEDIA